MKERPILFGGEMVRALLDGRKTHTRRMVKPQPTARWSFETANGDAMRLGRITSPHPKKGRFGVFVRREIHPGSGKYEHDIICCPYGQPGDRLWVREAHSIRVKPEHDVQNGLGLAWYRESEIGRAWEGDVRWRPSIHMPRWASRILLEVTAIRVERLQEISEADARAEGAFFTDYGRQCFHHGAPRDVGNCPAPDDHHPQRDGWSMVETDSHEQCLSSARMAFANIWEQINGHGAWAANPFVWVVEFKRIYQ